MLDDLEQIIRIRFAIHYIIIAVLILPYIAAGIFIWWNTRPMKDETSKVKVTKEYIKWG